MWEAHVGHVGRVTHIFPELGTWTTQTDFILLAKGGVATLNKRISVSNWKSRNAVLYQHTAVSELSLFH